MVAAGFALGLAGASQIAASREQGVIARPLAGRTPMLTTYLLRRGNEPSEVLARFIERRSEEHTSELQSLMRISYAVFCLKKTTILNHNMTPSLQTHTDN